jgi:hypothetical protein
LPFEVGRAEIIQHGGQQFDPDVVRRLLAIPEAAGDEIRLKVREQLASGSRRSRLYPGLAVCGKPDFGLKPFDHREPEKSEQQNLHRILFRRRCSPAAMRPRCHWFVPYLRQRAALIFAGIRRLEARWDPPFTD